MGLAMATTNGEASAESPPVARGWLTRFRQHAGRILQWLFLGILVGIACGIASAIFLHALDYATAFRGGHEALVYALPLAGVVIGSIYDTWGKPIKGGNNLVIDTVHEDSAQIPYRMGPMVLVGTVLTHLFGGSAGREGTAVQMGASLADLIAHRFSVPKETRRQILAAGVAGGFGSVFGTPIAGTIFGLEVVSIGKIEYDALFPALVSAVVGDLVTRELGITHTAYPAPAALEVTPLLLGKWGLFGVAVAVISVIFVELTHRLKSTLERRIPRLPVRMMLGGLVVVALWKLSGTSDYLGLGVPTIVRAFSDPHLPWFAFAAKLVFTATTLSAGFLGGEVTPLFFIGATLGNVLGRLLDLPLDLAAGVGLAALFGAAANTPIALSIMAVELLGANVAPHVVIVSVIAYLMAGHRGIYPAQRLSRKKSGERISRPIPLRDYRSIAPPAPSPADRAAPPTGSQQQGATGR
jgi:H+/Cl- antiporter ClcA